MPVGNYLQKFALFLILVIVSCKGDDKSIKDESSDDQVKNTAPSTPPASGSSNGDTINLSGKFVLFFGPEGFTASDQNSPQSEIAAFQKTSTDVKDSLAVVPNLSIAYSNANYFRIYLTSGNTMIVSKDALKSETGILVTDGNQPPTIKKGIYTSAEYLKLIREYFFLK